MGKRTLPTEFNDHQSRRTDARNYGVESARPIILRLPPELIDIIVGLLRPDQHSIATCGLVCKSWVPASRRHIFSEICVCWFDVLFSPLCTVYSAAQHLVIHTFENEDCFPALSSRLSNVTQITFRVPRFSSRATLAPLLLQLESLVLSQIRFDTPDLFLSLLRSCPQLQRMDCYMVSFGPHPCWHRSQDVHMPELKVLKVVACSGLSNLLEGCSGGSIPQLTTLNADFFDNECRFMPLKVMETVGKSLQRLEISGHDLFHKNLPFIARSFPCLTQLQCLTVRMTIHPVDCVRFLVDVLRHSTSPCLEELTIRVLDHQHFLALAPWSELDSVLATSQFQHAFRILTFQLVGSPAEVTTLTESLALMFPFCTERESFRVEAC